MLTCGNGRITRMSMMKCVDMYLFAIARGSSINSQYGTERLYEVHKKYLQDNPQEPNIDFVCTSP